MTEQEKIISLARKCHIESLKQSGYGVSIYELTDSAIVAFYKLAQSEAYEKAAKGVMGLNKLVDGTILPEAAVDAIRQLSKSEI